MISTDRMLVTGAKGFIGGHIIGCAKARGLDVVATGRGPATRDLIALDVCDDISVDAVFRRVQPTVVIHCASYGVNYADQDPELAIAVNIHGSLRVLSAAARYGARLFLHLGSCSEYGSRDGPISEDAPLNPTAIYGATKAAATLLLRDRARSLGINSLVARPFGTWGPSEGAHRLVPQIVDACIHGRVVNLTTCEVVRDYTYVEDVAERIVKLSVMPELPAHTIVNVGSGQAVVLRDFVRAVAKCLKGESLLHFGKLASRPTEMASLVADTRRLQEMLGNLHTTSLPDGVARMVTQYR